MLLSIDGTFLVQILNFIVFWIVLNYVFIAPTRRAIEGRQRHIADQYKAADEFAAQSAALQAQAEAILSEARRKTDEAMREAAARAADEAHDIERAASEDAAAEVASAHSTVASERKRVAAKQAPFVEELARTMAERAIDGEVVN